MIKSLKWTTSLLFLLLLKNSLGAYLPPTPAGQAAVVSAQTLASQAGVEILKAGGNAIDAAVAVGYALAVTHPCCGNIGGGGFMLIHLKDGKNLVIDFRETAPAAINSQLFLDTQGQVDPQLAQSSYLSIGVPGTVMGLNTALEKYGVKTLAQVMAPAIRLAEQGFTLNDSDVQLLKIKNAEFKKQANVAEIFLKNNRPFRSGERLVQPQLAKTLRTISQGGSAAFYKGNIAAKIVAASQAHHGVLSKTDFANYQVKIRQPLTCSYRHYQIITTPPPGSGVTLCEILNILAHFPLGPWGFHSAASIHYNVEAMRYAFADRNQKVGDPDFVDNPVQQLLSAEYAKIIADKIQPQQAGDSKALANDFNSAEGAHTTHYNVVDQWGNVVAVTYTINAFFGSGLIAGDTGFFLNNDMDDFAILPGVKNMYGLRQGQANIIAPKKRPLSAMSPTLIFKNHQFYMALGAAGGPTIITTITQSIENVLDYGMDINAAINQPRYHFQWLPDIIYLEPFVLSADTLQILKKFGYNFKQGSPFHTDYWGQELIIQKDPQTGDLYGASDNRRGGKGSTLGY